MYQRASSWISQEDARDTGGDVYTKIAMKQLAFMDKSFINFFGREPTPKDDPFLDFVATTLPTDRLDWPKLLAHFNASFKTPKKQLPAKPRSDAPKKSKQEPRETFTAAIVSKKLDFNTTPESWEDPENWPKLWDDLLKVIKLILWISHQKLINFN